MEHLQCTYLKKGSKCRKDKEGSFYADAWDKKVLCRGPSLKLLKKMPLLLHGYWENEEFVVQHMELDCGNAEKMAGFFSGSPFRKMGPVTARKLYTELDETAINSGISIDRLTKNQITAVCGGLGIDPAVTEKICMSLRILNDTEAVHDLVSSAGGTRYDTEKIYDALGERAMEVLTKAPYRGICYGLGFYICDRIAYLLGVVSEKERLDALCIYAAKHISDNGSSCMPIAQALTFMERVSGKNNYYPRSYLLCVLLSSGAFVVRINRFGPCAYPKKLCQTEESLAADLVRLERASVKSEILQENDSTLDPDQNAAVRGVLQRSGIAVITGPPGSGKTRSIRKIIDGYRAAFPDSEAVIRLSAPTGRAAARISESTKQAAPVTEEDEQWMKAVTVHRLIGARPYTDDNLQYTYHKNHRLPKGLYIVDEASMLDERLAENFLQAVSDGSLVIFTGDPDQLLSVDTGTVLKDIIDSGLFRVFRLTQIHRQAGKNRIVANYKKILNRDTSLEQGDDFRIIRVQTDEEIIKNTAMLYKQYQSPSAYGFQILTCTKKYLTGKDSINQMIASARHITDKKFEESDRIMMDSNNYRENYWNGDVGTVMRMHADGAEISFYDGTRFIRRDCFKDMEHAWACTIHKAQGSEYDVTCVILDGQCESLMYNRMILTAVTRAKEKCFIITKGDALERCIKSVTEITRYTGLIDMLKEIAEWERQA